MIERQSSESDDAVQQEDRGLARNYSSLCVLMIRRAQRLSARMEEGDTPEQYLKTNGNFELYVAIFL
jgi:hypothetical protein